jgi:hypothetical protein
MNAVIEFLVDQWTGQKPHSQKTLLIISKLEQKSLMVTIVDGLNVINPTSHTFNKIEFLTTCNKTLLQEATQ